LEEVLYHVEPEMADDDFESLDEEGVKDRLKSLFYLNERMSATVNVGTRTGWIF